MDQVISLLSSSPAVVSRPTNESLEASFGVVDSPLNAAPAKVDDSLFDYGDFLDSSATKRRRLSPAVDQKIHTTDHITPLKSPGFMFSDITDFNSIGNTPDIPQAKSKAKETVNKTSASWDLTLDDPIVCSSSAPNNQIQEEISKKPITIVIDDDDDGDEDDDFLGCNLAPSDDIDDHNDDEDLFNFDASQSSTFGISKKTTLLLEQLRREAESKGRSKKKKKVEDDFDSLSEGDALPSTKQKSVRRQPSSQTAGKNADRTAKALEREAAKLRRQQEKELQKEEKRKQKEEKEKQKRIAADIAEANKSKVDKAVSVGEMIVDISSTFQDTSIGTQTEEHMRNLGVEMNFSSSQIPNIVSWRRKVTAQYTDAGHWEPCAPTIKAEGHVLCFFTGDEFAEMAVAPPASNNTVKAYFQKISGEYPSRKQIYLIEGLAATIRKGKNSRNRSYQAAVLQQIDDNQANSGAAGQPPPPPPPEAATATASSQSKRKKARSSKKTASTTHVIDEDAIEDALLQLQVVHSCLVHETANSTESASWIKNFTEHISTVPYRRELMKSQDASFCMDVGQVRTGDDAGDAYVRMMQEVSRITAPIAYGVATQFPTVGRLVEAFDQGGALLLEDVKVCYYCVCVFERTSQPATFSRTIF
ncbi:uncharacterized protein ARB_02716 [Trichophyton benhamiae CBS 112371]|uniref:ERCC4 domain-containing protein n=1 Tax=Arthroderma benhamiae (strain ATCC MYA-4681 / CBS 112371) TaxID=663331 RepID=D4B2N3_ARTBC|nr:uncharacterized protein ARB_02716 [Trichophyton benhamiae CBS 112371]EFE30344.1 conserved hypothetical protein [Trichophyton benhamiae CBS 112371]